MKYRYLLWDIDGTILDFKAAEAASLRTLFEKYRLGDCNEDKIRRYSEINLKYWQALERNEMTKQEILVGRFREFFKSEGINPSLAEKFNEDYQLTLGDTIVFNDNAFEILKKERENHILVAVTNGTAIAQHKKLDRSNLRDLFHYVFISEEVGFEKPNRAFYDAVFSQLKNPPREEILTIGDSLTSDMQGGLNAGIDTCWYNPNGQDGRKDIPVTYEIRNLHEIEKLI